MQTRREFLAAAVTPLLISAPAKRRWIGYTEFRTNIPGSRHANNITMRACMIREDGSGRRVLAESLCKEPNSWTQFSGWSPDGKTAIIGRGWETPENAAWEEANKGFRFNDQWLYDMYQFDLKTRRLTNITAVERVSNYNTGLFYWPGDDTKLGFQALIKGDSHPFKMDRDGRNKVDLTAGSMEFAYGFSASPNGKRIAYHKNYRIFLADADGSHAQLIDTGNPFNFVPQWSPDGEWLLFVSGEHYNCHPYIVKKDGSRMRKVADRQGYRGVIAFLDVPDFHGGSSDVPVWSKDGKWIYYTAKIGESVELMRVQPDGKPEQLSQSKPGVLYFHPTMSPDGKALLVGSNRSGTRQQYVYTIDSGDFRQLTKVGAGFGAMWPHWQPFAT